MTRLPTDDGMALAFRTNRDAPVECAMEIAEALKSHPAIQLRIRIHSGPVNEVVDVNQRANMAGAVNAPLTPALLRLYPMFDPLRNDPRFQKLCESSSPR